MNDADNLLFPFINCKDGIRTVTKFGRLKKRCREFGVPYIAPRALRKARINWLLRQSARVDITAEMAQHTTETLLSAYQLPNHQIAAVEISRFLELGNTGSQSCGPGLCSSNSSIPIAKIESSNIPTPDCTSASGCLNCEHHRDIDSSDYVWLLQSYRHLKLIELALFRTTSSSAASHPAKGIIDVISRKLYAFSQIDETHKSWVAESEIRINEGDFHPIWDGFIRLLEKST